MILFKYRSYFSDYSRGFIYLFLYINIRIPFIYFHRTEDLTTAGVHCSCIAPVTYCAISLQGNSRASSLQRLHYYDLRRTR